MLESLVILGVIVGILSLIFDFIKSIIPHLAMLVTVFAIVELIIYCSPKARKNRIEEKLKKEEDIYYNSSEFKDMKAKTKKYVDDCNALNNHISTLKNTHIGTKQNYAGNAIYYDNSVHNYSRPEYKNHSYEQYVYNCSKTICDNARMHPFKYICKYFDIKPTEENLSKFEQFLNNLETAQDGSLKLKMEKNSILNSVNSDIPPIIKQYGYKNFQHELGFRVPDFNTIEYPMYSFQYVSSGGYASTRCDIIMDIENLNKFINYLSEKIKFNKSVEGQRVLMTSSLRRTILQRDNYTCQKCGNSTRNEPNLLLEVDHIIPLAKGGITKEDNLQVLCWRCNRSKSDKII